MNNERRKVLDQAFSAIEQVISDLTTARDEEQDAFDNLSENLQNSERGEKMSDAVVALSTAIDQLENANSEIETAKE